MSFWSTVHNAIASITTNEGAFRERLTPKNALDELRRFNENGAIRRAAQSVERPFHNFEWLMNSFQFASAVVSENFVLDMARYLNRSDVFQHVAPHFYESTTWNLVFQNLLNQCSADERSRLLSVFEERGHMQGIVKVRNLSAFVFFESFMGALSTEDTIRLLARSPSFAIARKTSMFALEVVESYPQYKSLLD